LIHKIYLTRTHSGAQLQPAQNFFIARAFLDILGKLAPEDMSPKGIGALMAKMLAQRK